MWLRVSVNRGECEVAVSVSRGECEVTVLCSLPTVKPECPMRLRVSVLTTAAEIELMWESAPVRFTELRDTLLHQVSYCSSEPPWE
ncbi:hypothetical protein chiPu_0024026, partial [Chiloscyllium punctatum]|nr:hypothetical protein [Chiloscyllium punctatum]